MLMTASCLHGFTLRINRHVSAQSTLSDGSFVLIDQASHLQLDEGKTLLESGSDITLQHIFTFPYMLAVTCRAGR